MKIVFAGTPEFAANHLAALLDSQHQVIAVYTQPDRRAGRGRQLTASPVKALALQHGITVYQPQTLKDDADYQQLAALAADLMVVVAYGLILPQRVLDAPRLGCVNVHASLLPRWRGAAPIQRAIEAGDAETGVTLMQMEAGLDTGPMLATRRCPIHADDTGGTLHDRLAELGSSALAQQLDGLAAGELHAEPQDEQLACYARKLDKQEARLDWQRPAATLERQIRAFNPWPVCQFRHDDKTLRVWAAEAVAANGAHPPGTVVDVSAAGVDVATGEGVLRLTRLQRPGGKPVTVREFLAVMPVTPGRTLGDG